VNSESQPNAEECRKIQEDTGKYRLEKMKTSEDEEEKPSPETEDGYFSIELIITCANT
jgi:hypothetical protein